MSEVSAIPREIPRPIGQRLRSLRRRLGQFLWVDGLSRLLAAVVFIVLVDLAIDRIFKMDAAQRLIMLCVMIACVVAVLYLRVIRPLLRRTRDDALILQVEDHNPELRESLISSVQFSREAIAERQGVSQSMVQATIEYGAKMASGLDFGNALNRGAFLRNLVLLAAGAVSIGAMAYGVVNHDFWRTWFNRNILLSNDQWPKDTRLSLIGVEDGHLTLPRGEDHKQLVLVDATSRVTDVNVEIEFDDEGRRTVQKMRRTGNFDGLEHLLVFRNVSSEFRFRAKGGDDVTDWVQVKLVDPPGWSALSLSVRMPEYTGVAVEELPDGSGPHSILEGSSLAITATANKPLSQAELRIGDLSLPMQTSGADEFSLNIPAENLVGGKYVFDLVDESGMRSSRPTSFTLKVKPDQPPRVRASLLGISGLVVPRARIPVSFTVTDEYAIDQVSFVHLWKGENNTSVPQQGTIVINEVEDQLGGLDVRSVQVFDMEPINVPVGVGLRLAVQASDNNTLTGPGVGQSREFLLRVVSEEELRADLLRREIEQRKAFELALQAQEKLTVEVRALAALLSTGQGNSDTDELLNELLAWQRTQKRIGTNIASIADRFEEFLAEVKNNRLDEAEDEIDPAQSIELRFNERIIQPIRQLDQYQIIRAVSQLELCQRSVDTSGALTTNLRTTANTNDEIISLMRDILAAMEDSETFQEVVNKVIELKRNEERVLEMTQEKKKQASEEDIFDKPPKKGGG